MDFHWFQMSILKMFCLWRNFLWSEFSNKVFREAFNCNEVRWLNRSLPNLIFVAVNQFAIILEVCLWSVSCGIIHPPDVSFCEYNRTCDLLNCLKMIHNSIELYEGNYIITIENSPVCFRYIERDGRGSFSISFKWQA